MDEGKVRDGRGRFIRSVDTAQRDARAAELRRDGANYQEIADRLGFSDRSRARQAVERALAATVAEPAAELRALELARLDEMWRHAWAVLKREHVAHSNGRVVHLDGKPLVDDGPVLNAIDRLLRIQERRAKLLGLDAPTRVESITIDQIESEISRLSAELGVGEVPRR